MALADIHWDYWRSFLAVLTEGSLSGAASQLGLIQPTVGRPVEALETALNVPLFVHSVRGLTPTDTALALIACKNKDPCTLFLLDQQRLPVLATVNDPDDCKMVVFASVDDQMRAVGVEPNRRINLCALSGALGVSA